jgi:hypothetical protein
MKVMRKMTENTWRRRVVKSAEERELDDAGVVVEAEELEYRVVKSWTVTRVEGQYIAGGDTRRFCSMPERSS